MKDGDFLQLEEDTTAAILRGEAPVAILGLTPVAIRLIERLQAGSMLHAVRAVFDPSPARAGGVLRVVPVLPLEALADEDIGTLVVAADAEKEDLLVAAVPHLRCVPKVIIAGYGHFAFRDKALAEEAQKLLVPSLANGYPNTLVHLYQCLKNSSRLELQGCVAEFGAFKGGTTVLLARLIRRLGMSWPVIGFDTFDGFPPRRSALDMYDHPGCVFRDLNAVSRYVAGEGVELVAGDIVATCRRLETEDVVLAFIDTDNFTPASAALSIVRERTLVGGAIVFDHFTGVDRFRYTLGERIAASALLDDPRYFNLHGTGVFLRQA